MRVTQQHSRYRLPQPLSHGGERDLETIRRMRSGDSDAEREMAERLMILPRLLAQTNRRRGHPLQDADLADLAQELTLKVWGKLDEFAGYGSLEEWLVRFCYYEIQNIRRAHSRRAYHQTMASKERPEDAPKAIDPLVAEEVQGLLAAVGPPCEEVLRLKHMEDLTFREIGQRLSRSTNTVKAQYYRGLQWMRDHYHPRES